jgi:chemotaxis regulatin CheY-phosphate phosphatase CheZ
MSRSKKGGVCSFV